MPIQCRYVFTLEEFQRAYSAYSLSCPVTLKSQLILFGYCAVVFNSIALIKGLLEFSLSIFLVFFFALNFCLLFALGLLFLFDKLRGRRPRRRRANIFAFRRSGLKDVQFDAEFVDSGITVNLPDRRTEWRWKSIARVAEDKDGFVLLIQPNNQNFIWLPKSGFHDVKDVDNARKLLETNISDFCLLD